MSRHTLAWLIPAAIFTAITILAIILATTTQPQGHRRGDTPRKDNPPCPPA